MVSTLMLGVPWQDFVGSRSCPNFSLCMASVESMVMFMSIDLDETIDDVKAHGREMVVESFDNLQPNVAWTRYFWASYYQFGK